MPGLNAINLRLPVYRQALDGTQTFNALQLVRYVQGCRQDVIGSFEACCSKGLKVQVHQALIQLTSRLPRARRQPTHRALQLPVLVTDIVIAGRAEISEGCR